MDRRSLPTALPPLLQYASSVGARDYGFGLAPDMVPPPSIGAGPLGPSEAHAVATTSRYYNVAIPRDMRSGRFQYGGELYMVRLDRFTQEPWLTPCLQGLALDYASMLSAYRAQRSRMSLLELSLRCLTQVDESRPSPPPYMRPPEAGRASELERSDYWGRSGFMVDSPDLLAEMLDRLISSCESFLASAEVEDAYGIGLFAFRRMSLDRRLEHTVPYNLLNFAATLYPIEAAILVLHSMAHQTNDAVARGAILSAAAELEGCLRDPQYRTWIRTSFVHNLDRPLIVEASGDVRLVPLRRVMDALGPDRMPGRISDTIREVRTISMTTTGRILPEMSVRNITRAGVDQGVEHRDEFTDALVYALTAAVPSPQAMSQVPAEPAERPSTPPAPAKEARKLIVGRRTLFGHRIAREAGSTGFVKAPLETDNQPTKGTEHHEPESNE